jgi:dTDP-glucose 4,6-dehydratase
MQNLLVTGGAGFIGCNFVRYMLDKYPDYTIVVYDKLTYAGRLENLQDIQARHGSRMRFVRGDICDAPAVEAAIRAYHIDTIINFAAESHVDRSILDPDAFIRTDVYGTYVLLEAARKAGNLRYHQISTDEVYGHIHGDHRSLESDCLAPRSPYAASKASADHMVNAYYITYGLPVTISRGANNIGPYQYPEKVVPLFVTNALNDMPLPVYGDGKQMRDYQYVLDHCAGIDVVLDDRDERPGIMFADMELIGVPHRVVVSERGLKDGQLEYQARTDTAGTRIASSEAVRIVEERVKSCRWKD